MHLVPLVGNPPTPDVAMLLPKRFGFVPDRWAGGDPLGWVNVGVLDKLLRIGEGRQIKRLEEVARQVNLIEPDYEAMSDEELRGQTDHLRAELADGKTLDEVMPFAFATIREACRRVLGKRPFDVQIMGGAALHWGNIAEMKTGEGKTIVALMPSYLNALDGGGVHVVTVNDYLAKYQSEQMGRVHHFLGMKVGVILAQMTPPERREAYACGDG